MNAERPHFLSQPVVKNIFVYRNGDPYYEARRLVINEKRVSNFETFLREVTGGVKPTFGAVRNIYTPKDGHRVASLEHLQSGEQYVAAGREKFKRLDYLQIAARKKRMQQINGLVKPVPQSRIIVSARFLKPIKEPCTIFVIANGDLLNPAVRLLIPHRIVGQYERILEMITEKIGMRILGGVRSLYTLNGTQITDGKELETGQLCIAVGREKFKKLPYDDLLFSKPTGIKRVFGSKTATLPPISRSRKQNGSVSMSVMTSSEPSEGEPSVAPQSTREHLSSIVKQVSQSHLISLRNKKSGLSMSLSAQDNDEGAPAAEGVEAENTEEKPAEQDEPKPQQTQAEEPPEQGTGSDQPDATTAAAADTRKTEKSKPAEESVADSSTTDTADREAEVKGEDGREETGEGQSKAGSTGRTDKATENGEKE
ncbi:doublecortin domain-containing protein 2-like, partial [Alosa sapidissima]|uniref:doublecortin domain-containing protein 2-like n=1 Tax=Alosa sapidissima TaxID=34773 RepID=UPI001C09F2DB